MTFNRLVFVPMTCNNGLVVSLVGLNVLVDRDVAFWLASEFGLDVLVNRDVAFLLASSLDGLVSATVDGLPNLCCHFDE